MVSPTRVALTVLLAAYCGLFAACDGGSGPEGTGGQQSTGSGPSDGSTGGSSSGGESSGGAPSSGGSGGESTSGGGSSTGGQAGGGAGGEPAGTGGFPNPFEGYPEWVQGCAASRALAQCPSCLTAECIVCTYGTDDEIEETESSCTETAQAYASYCDCASCENSVGGACRYP